MKRTKVKRGALQLFLFAIASVLTALCMMPAASAAGGRRLPKGRRSHRRDD